MAHQKMSLSIKAITQSLNSLVYYRDKHRLLPISQQRVRSVERYLDYPIIVCNDLKDGYMVDTKGNLEEVFPVPNPFQIEVNYTSVKKGVQKNEYFLIDVVTLDKLDDLIQKVVAQDINPLLGSLEH